MNPLVYRGAQSFHRLARAAANRWMIRPAVAAIPGLEMDSSVRLAGWPLVEIADGAGVTLEPGVVLNSDNRGYHLNMHSPVKLVADRRGARIRVGSGTRLHGTCVHAYARVEIGARCLVAANTQIMDGDGHDLALRGTTVSPGHQRRGQARVAGGRRLGRRGSVHPSRL